ncbi:MAG: hypothetical protein IJP31_08070 [Lachnospiraceae bacterium]|nr:hypothetical protein [Lachnospiraceae bacterium]
MWNKLKWHIQRFMIGRNGRDELELAVFYASFILYILGVWLRFSLLEIIAWMGLLYSLFRILSKNVYKRREENRRFLQKVQFLKLRLSMRKTHKIYCCKGCKRKIRVPRGKGKIEITCPMCGKKMIRRT